ncbi:MAG: FAD-dependent monooxygenase [Planctomycetota bacterium]|jgi:flavin-dependent dehydrogenase|nr:FAD-dependent monooxygenase [Planctomycetota bacterium]
MAVFDVIIVGAGPAGSTLARLLGGQRSVLLLEARNILDAPPSGTSREKCCGGLLAPDAQAMLRRLDLQLSNAALDSRQPLAVRALDLATGQSRLYPREYVNMDRPAFERWLLSLLPEGAAVRENARVVSVLWSDASSGWHVRVREPYGVREERSRLLVAADGAGSIVRRLLGSPPRPECRYLAVQDVFESNGSDNRGVSGRDEYLAFFHPTITDFYGWVIPKRDRTLLGVLLPSRSRRNDPIPLLMTSIRERLAWYGHVFSGPAKRQGGCALRPKPEDVFLGVNGAFCVGEAAGFISPSSAEGFSYAFSSAEALAASILGGFSGRNILADYAARTRRLRLNMLAKNWKARVMYSPPLRRLVMRSGIFADRRG